MSSGKPQGASPAGPAQPGGARHTLASFPGYGRCAGGGPRSNLKGAGSSPTAASAGTGWPAGAEQHQRAPEGPGNEAAGVAPAPAPAPAVAHWAQLCPGGRAPATSTWPSRPLPQQGCRLEAGPWVDGGSDWDPEQWC